MQALVARQRLALNARAFIGDLAHASRTFAIAALQLLHNALRKIRVARALCIERAVKLESLRIFREQLSLPVERRARRAGEYDRRLDPRFVHRVDPILDIFSRPDSALAGVGMDVYHGEARLVHLRLGHHQRGLGRVVLEQERIHRPRLHLDSEFRHLAQYQRRSRDKNTDRENSNAHRSPACEYQCTLSNAPDPGQVTTSALITPSLNEWRSRNPSLSQTRCMARFSGRISAETMRTF